jgi:8-hydroxy-5-deazaflavin:NADPH oxidoreductase
MSTISIIGSGGMAAAIGGRAAKAGYTAAGATTGKYGWPDNAPAIAVRLIGPPSIVSSLV